LDHEKSESHLALSALKDWIFTWSADGVLTVRTIMEPDKSTKIAAHDPFAGGVHGVAVSPDSKLIYTIGADNIFRFWDWKFSSVGKRNASEASAAAQAMFDDQSTFILDVLVNVKNIVESKVFSYFV
jgi:WD40 repeat protein